MRDDLHKLTEVFIDCMSKITPSNQQQALQQQPLQRQSPQQPKSEGRGGQSQRSGKHQRTAITAG